MQTIRGVRASVKMGLVLQSPPNMQNTISTSLLSVLIFATACTPQHSDVDDGEKADILCSTANIDFTAPTMSTTFDLGESDEPLVHTGTFTVTRDLSGFVVEADEVILHPMVDDRFRIHIKSPMTDPFTTLQFWVDYRELGEADWKLFDTAPEATAAGWWFHDLEVSSYSNDIYRYSKVADVATCQIQDFDGPRRLKELAMTGKQLEFRIRPYTKDGLRDLSGSYDYTLTMER